MKTVLMLVTRPVSPTVSHVKGDTVTIEDDLADYYLRIGAARYAAPPPIPAMLGKDASGNTVLVGAGGDVLINTVPVVANDPSSAALNTAAIQAALISRSVVEIRAKKATDVVWIDETLVIPSNTELKITAGSLQPTSRKTTLRSGNCHVYGSRSAAIGLGFVPICHSSVSAQKIGTVQIVKSGGNFTFSYRSQSDGSYGSGVLATASGKMVLTSATGEKLYMRQSCTHWGSVQNGTYTQQVIAIPTDMPPRAVSLSRTSGVVTATETGHGRSPGDLVMMLDASAGFGGLFIIKTVVDANTYTYDDAQAGDGAGTAIAYAEKNVAVTMGMGATMLGPTQDALQTPDQLMTQWVLTNGVRITGGRWKNQGNGKYAGNLHGVSKVLLDGMFFDSTCSDGFTVQGGLYQGVYRNTYANQCHDTVFGVGITPDDTLGTVHSPLEPGFFGVSGLTIENLRFDNLTTEPIRFFGGANQRYDNIVVRDVYGRCGVGVSTGMSIFYDTGMGGVLLGNTACTAGRMVFENIEIQGVDGQIFAPIQIDGANTVVDQLIVKNIKYTHQNNGGAGYSYGPGVVNIVNGNVKNLLLENAWVKDNSAGSFKVNGVRVKAGAVLGRVVVNGGYFDAIDAVYRNEGSMTQGGHVALRDATLVNTTIGVQLSSAVLTVHVQNVYATGIYRLVNASVNPATKCRITGSNNVSNDPIAYLTGANWSVNGFQVDGALTTPEKGDVFYNTNAAYGAGVGLYAMGASSTTRIAA